MPKAKKDREIIAENNEAAYYSGRVLSSQFFIGSEFSEVFRNDGRYFE